MTQSPNHPIRCAARDLDETRPEHLTLLWPKANGANAGIGAGNGERFVATKNDVSRHAAPETPEAVAAPRLQPSSLLTEAANPLACLKVRRNPILSLGTSVPCRNQGWADSA